MIYKIEEWINQLNRSNQQVRKSCIAFKNQFKGFYSTDFLTNTFFVVVDKIPKPDIPELRKAGLGDFIDMDAMGITYNDTYYIKEGEVNNLRLHFHELVHVVQWRELAPQGFIERYIGEIQAHGYKAAPLEKMAYALDGHFQQGRRPFNVEQYIRDNL